VQAGKKAVLYDTARGKIANFKSAADWRDFLAESGRTIADDLRKRATPEEWHLPGQAADNNTSGTGAEDPRALASAINRALQSGNPSTVAEVLGEIARNRGMTQLAKDAGLARESLYRALSASGNPEFATVFRVLNSLGLRLTVAGPEKTGAARRGREPGHVA
jgi:probable addiction module antidote protein